MNFTYCSLRGWTSWAFQKRRKFLYCCLRLYQGQLTGEARCSLKLRQDFKMSLKLYQDRGLRLYQDRSIYLKIYVIPRSVWRIHLLISSPFRLNPIMSVVMNQKIFNRLILKRGRKERNCLWASTKGIAHKAKSMKGAFPF